MCITVELRHMCITVELRHVYNSRVKAYVYNSRVKAYVYNSRVKAYVYNSRVKAYVYNSRVKAYVYNSRVKAWSRVLKKTIIEFMTWVLYCFYKGVCDIHVFMKYLNMKERSTIHSNRLFTLFIFLYCNLFYCIFLLLQNTKEISVFLPL